MVAQKLSKSNSQSRVADRSTKIKTEITSAFSKKKQMIMLTYAVLDKC